MTDATILAADLETLKAAYRSGGRTISYEGKSVTYGSAEEMRAVIAAIEAELGISPPVRTIIVRSNKGW